MRLVYQPSRQAEMPDVLSRRSDYQSGKGTTFQADQKPTQALPNFDKYRGGQHETLCALQDFPLRSEEENYINPYGLINGHQTDINIKKLRDQMLSVVCVGCLHATCKSPLSNYPSIYQRRRRTRNPELVERNWTKLGMISFGT